MQQDHRGRQRPREFPPRPSPPRGPAPDSSPQGVDQTNQPAFAPDAEPSAPGEDERIEHAGEELEGLAEAGERVGEPAEGVSQIGDRVDRLDVDEQEKPAVERVDGTDGRVDQAAIDELLSDTPSEPQTENAERTPTTAAEARLGSEGLSRLRARYSEVLARISETITDPVRRDQLKSHAERLNPDTWVTDVEVSDGLEAYETVFESLRTVVGRRRRRRRRSGGRNRQTGPADSGQEPSSSDSAGVEESDTNDTGESVAPGWRVSSAARQGCRARGYNRNHASHSISAGAEGICRCRDVGGRRGASRTERTAKAAATGRCAAAGRAGTGPPHAGGRHPAHASTSSPRT